MARIEDTYAKDYRDSYLGDMTFRTWGIIIGGSLMFYGLIAMLFLR